MKKIMITLGVIFILFVAYRFLNLKKTTDQDSEVLKTVKVLSVDRGRVEKKIYYQGKILGKNQASLKSPISLKAEKALVKVGDAVKKGQRIVQLDNSNIQSQLSAAEAQLASAEENLNMAESEFQRQKVLFDQKAISEKAFQGAKSQLESAKAGVKAAKNAVVNGKKQYNDSFLAAPFSGIVSALNVQAGELATPNDVLAVITDTSSWRARVDLAPVHMDQIQLNIPAIIVTSRKDTLMGTVSHVDQGISSQSGKGVSEIVFKNENAKIIPGTWAEIYFIADVKENVVRVPSYSLLEETKISNVNEGGSIIGFEKYYQIALVVNDSVKIETIVTGIEDLNWVEVIDGVNEGDKIITEGQRRVRNNEPVKIVQ